MDYMLFDCTEVKNVMLNASDLDGAKIVRREKKHDGEKGFYSLFKILLRDGRMMQSTVQGAYYCAGGGGTYLSPSLLPPMLRQQAEEGDFETIKNY